MATQKEETKPVIEKELLVKKYGDSFYIPLTKFFKKMNIKENTIVKVTLYEDGKLVVKK